MPAATNSARRRSAASAPRAGGPLYGPHMNGDIFTAMLAPLVFFEERCEDKETRRVSLLSRLQFETIAIWAFSRNCVAHDQSTEGDSRHGLFAIRRDRRKLPSNSRRCQRLPREEPHAFPGKGH